MKKTLVKVIISSNTAFSSVSSANVWRLQTNGSMIKATV